MVPSKVKEIKQSFRQMMDGSIAQSMRDKGLNYHLNWGATLPRLQEMAKEIANSQEPIANCQYDLAIALWKENVRECKILATMLMPADQILPEVVDIWMEQIPSQEIADSFAGDCRTTRFQPLAASALCAGESLPVDSLRQGVRPTLWLPCTDPFVYEPPGAQRARHQRVSRPDGSCPARPVLVGA